MKSILLFATLILVSLHLKAQGGASCAEAVTAVEFSTGSNSANHTGDIDQWFKYTATQDEKITIYNCESTTADTKVEIYTSCGAASPIHSSDNYCGNQSKIAFKATSGQTYYIRWRLFDTPYTYNWYLKEETIQTGDFCDSPFDAILGTNSADHSCGVSQWYTYTPTTDGKLTISSCGLTGEDTFIEIYTNCEGYPFIFNNNYCNYQSLVTFESIANTTYYIRWKNNYTSSSYNWTISEADPEVGDFCIDPLTATIGTNSSDHTKGVDQWFTYTASIDGEITVSSCTQTNEDTFVEIYNDCDTKLYSNNDYCNTQSELSFPCTQGTTYYILWTKHYTTGSYNWTLSEEDITTGNYCSTPYENLIIGTNHASHTSGYDQWYKYTPETSSRVEVSNCGLTTENTDLAIYKSCGSTAYISVNNTCNSQESVIFPAYIGETYYINWKSTYSSGEFDWTLTSTPLSEGEECTQPLSALLGTNSASHLSDIDQWYTFTAEETGSLVISSCEATNVDTKLQVYSDCNTLLAENDDNCEERAELTYEITNDETIYIRWMGEKAINQNYNWDISYDYSTSILKNEMGKEITLYPNPCAGNFTIDLESYTNQKVQITIFDISGRLIKSISIQGGNKIPVSLKNIAEGTYLIKVIGENNYIQRATLQVIR
ncbi:T9SS type A sorting domain-containing protein [Labilibacter sediminis]|nr:T9SS type A sorting domain-containing protein [Labilibacter sediminis]